MHDFPQPHFLACPDCGQSVPRATDGHACDDELRLDFRLFQLRGEIASFDVQLTTWLYSPAGRFAAWLVQRDR
jgi:hypothetical protein